MAISRRVRVLSAAGAIGLLAGAWVLTEGDTTERTAATTTTTTRPPTTTVVEGGPTTTTTEVERVANTQWGAINFTDITEQAGLDAPQSAKPPVSADGQAGGAAVADYDADGDQDVYLTRLGLPNRLMRNDGTGRFTDVAEQVGAEGTDTTNGYASAVWADVEGDGDLDLYATGAGRGGSMLLINDGDGQFDDQTERAGLDDLAGTGVAGTASFGAAFDDWDHDGDLDLVTLHWYKAPLDQQILTLPTPNDAGAGPEDFQPCRLSDQRAADPAEGLPGSRSALFENDGTGRFTDVTDGSGVDVDNIIGFQPVFADVDGDGWNDLFITGDFCTSRLFRNEQGTGWTDITDAAGVGTDQNGMGSVVADLTGDGQLDWFVTSIAASNPDSCLEVMACSTAGNRLFVGDGTGKFTDETDRYGLRDGSWGWGAAGADLNLDGRLDLPQANGARFLAPGDEIGLQPGDDSADDPTRVWINTGDDVPWPDAAPLIGVDDEANGKALVTFDADGDGDLDLLIANTEVAPVLYRNDTPTGADKHWLGIRLRAPGTPNPFGIGARVTVDVGDGSAPRPMTVAAGGSFESGDPTDLHVGLGPAERVARIEIRWPGEDQPQVVTDVAADQVVEITRR